MDSIEAATLITLKAMETSKIGLKGSQEVKTIEDVTAFNAEQIAKFYRTVHTEVRKARLTKVE